MQIVSPTDESLKSATACSTSVVFSYAVHSEKLIPKLAEILHLLGFPVYVHELVQILIPDKKNHL
jgi:hypothetical protein